MEDYDIGKQIEQIEEGWAWNTEQDIYYQKHSLCRNIIVEVDFLHIALLGTAAIIARAR